MRRGQDRAQKKARNRLGTASRLRKSIETTSSLTNSKSREHYKISKQAVPSCMGKSSGSARQWQYAS